MSVQREPVPKPLTPVTFHVLLALSDGPLHGYGVMRRVEDSSGTAVGPGTIYGSLNRLLSLGWVEDGAVDATDPRRGSCFVLTAAGRAALRFEARRLESLAHLARKHRVLEQGSQ